MGAEISVSYILITALLTSIVLGTMIGNFFVIVAILVDKNLQTSGNQLVLSLAVADLMVACLVMPLGAYNDIHQGWYLGTEICEFWTSADVLCCTASILNLLAIALDRYWAVTNVDYIYRRTKERVNLMILCVWTFGTIVSVAPILGWKDPEFGRRVLVDHKCMVSQDVAYQIFATISTFYAPLVLLLALYWRIFQVARKRIHKKPGERTGTAQCQTRGDTLGTHTSSLSGATCKELLKKQVRIQEEQPEGEMKKDFRSLLTTSTNPAELLVSKPPLVLLLKEEQEKGDKLSAVVSETRTDLEQQQQQQLVTCESRGEQPSGNKRRASGCGKKKNEATDTNKWTSQQSPQPPLLNNESQLSTRCTYPADRVNCRKLENRLLCGDHFTLEKEKENISREASIDEFIDDGDDDDDDEKSRKYPELNKSIAHSIASSEYEDETARRIGDVRGKLKMDYNKSNESQRGAQVGTKSDAATEISSVEATVAAGTRGREGKGHKVAPMEDERGIGNPSSWLEMSPAVLTREDATESRMQYNSTGDTIESAGRASSCCCCACDVCLEACTSCRKELSTFKQQELTATAAAAASSSSSSSSSYFSGYHKLAAKAKINHGANTKYARRASVEQVRVAAAVGVALKPKVEPKMKLSAEVADKVAHLSAHSSGLVVASVFADGGSSGGHNGSVNCGDAEKAKDDEDFISNSSDSSGSSSENFDCRNETEGNHHEHPSQINNNYQQLARFVKPEMSSFEQQEDEDSSLSTAFPPLAPLIMQLNVDQVNPQPSQVKDHLHLELAGEEEESAKLTKNNNTNINIISRTSSTNKSVRSLDLRRKFRALGQIVSFVQTSENFSYSSENVDQHELTGTSEGVVAGSDLRDQPSQIKAANFGPSSITQQAQLLLSHNNNSEINVVQEKAQQRLGIADSAGQLRVSHAHQQIVPKEGPNGSTAIRLTVQRQEPQQQQQQQQFQLQRRTRPDMEMRREKKAAKTLAIITGVFVCCWLPFFLNAIIMPICGPSCTPSDLILSILLWLGYLNSLLNPIIYTIFSPDFRRAFRRLLCWPRLLRLTETLKSGKG